MTLAIDFDNTWTAEPRLFESFWLDATAGCNHTVIIATSRHPDNSPITEEERERYSLPHTIPVYPCKTP
jgi:hypothetical protein